MQKTHPKKPLEVHPRVKIYYLKNDSSTQAQTQHYSAPIAGPSISCLSSFIQKQKNPLPIQPHEQYWPSFNIKNEDEEPELTSIPVISFTQQAKPTTRDPESLQTAQVNKRTVCTTDLKPMSSPIHSNTFHIPSSYQKRFIRTSQEKYFQNHENNEALSKDFLCNIVKEWNTFTEREKSYLKKSVLNKRKHSIDSHKIYRPQEIEELKKNKSLMKQHFNLFLENQKAKSTKKKEKSLTLLKAIFHRQDSESSMVNKNMETPQIDFNNTKGFKKESIPRAKTSAKAHNSERRFSVNEKNPKSKYFRLLYGPQVKLIPRLFEEKSKVKNFDWTKLDKRLYESKKKVKSIPQFQQI